MPTSAAAQIPVDGYGPELFNENENIHYDVLPVTVTWDISIKKIQSESAKQFMYLCAYMAPEDIGPIFFEKNKDDLPSPLKEDIEHELKRNKLISQLLKYSLISSDKGLLSMHRLLQEVIRNKLPANNPYIISCIKIIDNIYTYEHGNIESQNLFLRITPHALAVADNASSILEQDDMPLTISSVYHTAGLGHLNLASYIRSMENFKKALAIREKVLGREHPYTATSYNNIALVYDSQGDYPKALEWYKKALAIFEKVLGKEHPSTQVVRDNIRIVNNK